MMVSKFLDPKNDFAFRRVFGSERNKDILIPFLNDMLIFREGKPIVDVTFLKTVQDPETASHKTSMVDVLCRDQAGHTYIVEMQVAKGQGFEKRAQYYAAKAYIAQMKVGGAYHDLKEVIFLAITDFVMFPDKASYKSDHVMLDRQTHTHDLKDFSFTFLELPKFHKTIDELTTPMERWAYFFKHADETHEKDVSKIMGLLPPIERAYEELNRFNWDEIEMNTYEEREKRDCDRRAIEAYQREEIYEKGREEGIAKGMEKGREKGREEGMQSIIQHMKNQGLPLEEIAKLTGLDLPTLKKL